MCCAEESASQTNENDADVLDRAIGQQPLEVVLSKGECDAKQGAGGTGTHHDPARRRRHRKPSAETHNPVDPHLDGHA